MDPGRYGNLSTDFSEQIEHFRSQQVEILSGVPIPPDFTTFWTQAVDSGFRPTVATVAKALLFPESVDALGEYGHGLTTEMWWSPVHPFTSSLTGETTRNLATSYTVSRGRTWTQPLGFIHALFEVALDVLRRTADVDDREAVLASLRATDLDTIAGRIAWTGRPMPNVCKTGLVGGQWRRFPDGRYELNVITNEAMPEVPIQAPPRPLEF